MSTPLTARLAEDYADAARALGASAPRAARRQAAIAALTAQGLPSAREDNWKYANLRPLERQKFVPVSAGGPAPAAALPAAVPGFTRYVFVDGVFAPALSAPLAAGAAAITSLAAADESDAAPDATAGAASRRTPDERFALLNEAFAIDGAAIRVAAAHAAAEPVRLELLFVASADAQAGASYPRLELQLEPLANVQLIERHTSCGAAGSFVNSAVSLTLGRGATLHHFRLQQLSARTLVFDTLGAVLEREARYRLAAINTGAQSARSTIAVQLAGEQAELALSVLTLGELQQVHDTFARVEHSAPRARTEQTFRGIAGGRARVAFNGKIVVAPGAHGSDSHQSLRGLLAGSEAEIDVRPQLEIHTDEVRCSHGATAGKLDEGMLFYLLARGLDRSVAERLLKWAFLEDVVAKITIPELRRQIETQLARQVHGPEAATESA